MYMDGVVGITFYSSCEPQKAVFIESPNVARVQPSLIINGLLSLLLIVQVAHEHMTTKVTHLN